MIRRNDPKNYLLIAQTEHAAISGHIAAHWGSELYPVPQPKDAVVTAIEVHDAGWSMHDDKPTLNADKLPASFYEMPIGSYLRIWVASVSAAAARGGPMAGLIVSWHFTALARVAPTEGQNEAVLNMLSDFAAAQHGRQADYCQALGLSRGMSDFPQRPQTQRDRDALYNYWILRASDWLSLMLCDNALPSFIRTPPEPPQGIPPLTATWVDPQKLCVKPWPLKVPSLRLGCKAIRVAAGQYRRAADLLRVFQHGEKVTLDFELVAPK